MQHPRETDRLLQHVLINEKSYPQKTGFSVFGYHLPFNLGLVIFCIGVIIGGVGQQISLPIYLSTFGSTIGPFFVLWSCSLFFALFFGGVSVILYFRGVITSEMLKPKWMIYFFLIGLFDSLNGYMAVYSAFLARVPGALQTILLQANIPVTLIFSKLIVGKNYTFVQLIGAFFIFVGVFVSLIPLIIGAVNHEVEFAVQAWYWPLICIGSTIPGALMNIIQEKFQDKFREEATEDKRFSVFYYQAWESTFQFFCMTALFWLDLVPGFGLSANIEQFWTTFTDNCQCFLRASSAVEMSPHCDYTMIFGGMFIGFYILSYIFGTEMTLYASANLSTFVSTISPIIVVAFWFSLPSINIWAGGSPYTNVDMICNIAAIPAVILGILLFRRNEAEDKGPEENEGEIELCC